MKISIADLRIILLEEQHSMDRAEGLAWAKKADAFGVLNRILSRPRDEDFELLYKEKRYQPFWHVVGTASYVYERRATYEIAASGLEVKSVTINGSDYEVTNGKIHLDGLEHCSETSRVEQFVDALAGDRNPSLAEYMGYPSRAVTVEDLGAIIAQGTIVVPPQMASSGIVRDVVNGLVKQVVADEIVDQVLELECLDLYFRPVYAFQYRWISKERDAVIEYDALTGRLSMDGRLFSDLAGQPVDTDLLTPVEAETVRQLLPGGQLAIKVEPQAKR